MELFIMELFLCDFPKLCFRKGHIFVKPTVVKGLKD